MLHQHPVKTFTSKQTTRLRWLVAGLERAGVGRADAQVDKKVTSHALLDAMRNAKGVRLDLRSSLELADLELSEQNSVEASDARRTLRAVLDRTITAGADADLLAEQLTQLADQAESAAIAPLVAEAGAPDDVAAAREAVSKLHELAQATAVPRGTPKDTERLDVLDGLLVQLVRHARRGARALARKKATPAIASAYELTELYRRAPKSDEPTPTPVA